MDLDICNIKLNETVILQKGTVLKAVKLIPEKLIVFEKLRFKPENAVGQKFGTIFNVRNSELIPVNNTTAQEVIGSSGKDNRSLTDTFGKSQALKRGDLLQLKADGATGEQIIQNLVDNSSSFSQKTVFSQNKYLKKKQRKYFSYLKIHKPTSRLICKLYEDREPAKICHMHMDSMSQMLTSTNVRSGSKVAVFETCSGLVMGMILERLGGQGCVINFHVGETPANIFAISHFNFPESYWNIMHPLPLHKLAPFLASHSFESTFSCLETVNNTPEVKTKSSDCSNEANLVPMDTIEEAKVDNASNSASRAAKRKHPLTDEEKLAVRTERQQKRINHQRKAWKHLEARNIDALIVATKYHPTPIVLALLDVLALSKPFAVYFEHKEPLMELFVRLSTSNAAINLQLTDTFMRHYQVLPERTHPRIMIPGNTGYLLTGIKVK